VDLHYIDADALGDLTTPLLVIPVLDDEDGKAHPTFVGGLDSDLAEGPWTGDLRGKLGEFVGAYGPNGRVVFLGAGKAPELNLETVRRYLGHAVRYAECQQITELTVVVPTMEADVEGSFRAAGEGATLAAWRFTELKKPGDDPPTQVASIGLAGAGSADEAACGIAAGRAIADGANFARALQYRPGNVATPTHLAEQATEMAASRGIEMTVFGPDELRADNCHALLAVSQGSDEEPRMIVMSYSGGGDGDAPLVLVGKGLTFDAGGISLKPPKGMEEMKYDMSGGAAVIGALHAIADLGLRVNVVGVVPSSENLINGSAVKPGDIIQSREGKTIEVVNTDAEGRLILADALSYAQTLKPAAVVDCATLTGSVVIALGHHAAAVMGTDEKLVQELKGAGERSGERCWPFPLWDEYRRQLDSEVADIVNVGGRPAGSITAACFLREFTGDVKWAHLDIAGTAYGQEPLPYQRKGGFGFPTRLLVEWVRGRAT